MSGGGGIFGGLAALDKKIQETLDPINRYIDPIGTQAHRVIANKAFEAFNPKPNQPQATTAQGGSQATAGASSRATAPEAGAGGGIGAGAKDLVTLPPNTPEGDRMRLNKMAALAGGTNTLLGN